jgi:hypothetical protein
MKKELLRSLFFLTNILIITACSHEKRIDSIDCRIDTEQNLSINIEANLVRLNSRSQIKRINGQDIIFTYNGLYNANNLQVINLQGRNSLPSIPLPSEGKDALVGVKSFYVHSQDSIFILTSYYLAIINMQGRVLVKHPINRKDSKITGIDFSKRAIFSTYHDPPYFSAKENALYVGLINIDSDPFTKSEYYEGAIAGKLNLSNLTLEELPIYYPEKLREKRYGTLRIPNVSFLEDKIVYGFQYTSSIYIYDKKSGKTTQIPCRSQYARNEAPPVGDMTVFDRDKLDVYHASNSRFFRMIYDPYRNLWYRMHFDESHTERNGVYGKKGLFIIIWDENFQKIDEFQIHFKYNPFLLFPMKEALLLFDASVEDENVFVFKKIETDCS